ncbi:hypothetical protein INR49_028087, partial [Caranx melampygus]
GQQNEEVIHYAALEEHRVNRTRRQRSNTKSEYSYDMEIVLLGQQNEEVIHYAALEEHRVNRTRRQRNNIKSECVYSSVKVQI